MGLFRKDRKNEADRESKMPGERCACTEKTDSCEASAHEDASEDVRILSCSFTGHRNILPEHLKTVEARLSRAVEYAYSKGCRIFYCGGAIGFDTLAAREVLRFKINHSDVSLHLILPCQNQEQRWCERQKDAYYYILKHADSAEYLFEHYVQGCMQKRNKKLAELGDILVAYLYKSSSGSAQTVRLAKALGKPVYNIAPSAF